jgi:hypothetical protein
MNKLSKLGKSRWKLNLKQVKNIKFAIADSAKPCPFAIISIGGTMHPIIQSINQ